jgi:uncharacterized protein
VLHPDFGNIYAYEVDGFGSRLLMDEPNMPNLLSLPYLAAGAFNGEVYRNTRTMILSEQNPYFVRGKFGEMFADAQSHTRPNRLYARVLRRE